MDEDFLLVLFGFDGVPKVGEGEVNAIASSWGLVQFLEDVG